MSGDRWRRVGELFDAALARDAAGRAALLAEACAGDAPLRREVESLLAAHDRAGGFLEDAPPQGVEPALAPGRRLGRYEVVGLVAAGGMGEVYRARDALLDREVALKVLRRDAALPGAIARLEQEARAASALDHPNVLVVHDVGAEGALFYVVSELLEGASLRARLSVGTPLELATCLDWGRQLAEGLAAAHDKGIVHRDLKPENVFVTRQGRIKILDFGIAKLLPRALDALRADAPARTEPGAILGTVGYMSPEQIEGGIVDARSDVFAFGAVLYELLSGRRAFAAGSALGVLHAIVAEDPPPLARAGAPAELEALVSRCLAKDPAARYASGRELASALVAVPGPTRGGLGASAPRPPARGAAPAPAPGTAYELYLDGKRHLLRHTLPEYIAAIDAFERARAADPSFAPALAGIADAYAWIAFSFQPEGAWYERASAMLDQALALDPELPEAHYVRGRLLWTPQAGFDHAGAIREQCAAIAARPALDAAYHELGMVLYHVGLLDEALAEQEHPLAIPAGSLAARLRSAFCWYLEGAWEEALAASDAIAREFPDAWNDYLRALCLLHLDRPEAAMATAERMRREAPGEALADSVLGVVLALRGDVAGAREQARLLQESRRPFGHHHHLQYDTACIHALSGDADEAVTWLSQAARNGFPCQPFFERDPLLASLAGHPRFERLLSELRDRRDEYAHLYRRLRAPLPRPAGRPREDPRRRDAAPPERGRGRPPALPAQEIRFCTAADGVRIAYASAGAGPPLVKAANWLTHLELDWESPVWRHWMRELARHHRLVRYDERGNGLSDWAAEDLSLTAFVTDLEAVVEAAGLERHALLGISQGCAIAIAHAVRHPERVSRLVLYGGYAQGWRARGDAEEIEVEEAMLTLVGHGWGRPHAAFRQLFTSLFFPGATLEQMDALNDLQRRSTSPGNAVRLERAFGDLDVTALLPRVRVPTLVLHARDDRVVPFEQGRLLAMSIPGARFVPLESANHILAEDEPAWQRFRAEVGEFLAGDGADLAVRSQ